MRDPHLLIVAVILGGYCLGVIYLEARAQRLAGPVGLWAGLTILHFALPSAIYAWDPDYFFEYQPNGAWATQGVVFTLVAFMAYQFGVWYVANQSGANSMAAQDHSHEEWSAGSVIGVSVLLSLVGWAARVHIIQNNSYFQISRNLGALDPTNPFTTWIYFAELLPVHVLCILAVHLWHPMSQRSKGWLLALIVVEAIELGYWAPTGIKEVTVLIIILPMLIRYLQVNRLPSKLTIIGFAVFIIVLFPMMLFYRWAMEKFGGLGSDVFTMASVAVSVLENSSGEMFEEAVGDSIFEPILARFALIEPVSACLRLINTGQWDLFLGKSYGEGLLGFIPRIIWPTKPDLHYGTEFGHAAGYLSANDWHTSISVTFVGEAYLNYWWFGFVPFILIGILYGSIYNNAKHSAHRQTWALVYAVTLETILYVGGTFGGHFGGLVKLWPMYFVIGALMRRGQRIRIKQEQPLLVTS